MFQMINDRVLVGLSLAALLLATAACGPARTAAATQPSPAAFDPSMSDDKALALVDAMVQELGGSEAWEQVKELRWETKYYDAQDALEIWLKHSWDRWNGRHRYERPDTGNFAEAYAAGKLEEIKWYVAMYDLFNRERRAYATYQGNDIVDTKPLVDEAYDKWQQDSYLLTMLYKLRDPGVQLSYVGEVQDIHGRCATGCIEIKVSYLPEVGEDTWFVDIDKETKLPEILSKQLGAGRIAFAIPSWTEAGGLKFPGKFEVLGANQSIEVENVSIHDKPDNTLYVPPMR